ncbi:phage tail tip lysozyme [Labrys neptuniae]|uniref:Phage tail tip lysozyme n=1 Tax=Labrys neptuniae TaxID=376174 RepID=A0ABV3PWT3_9HYPH
MSALVWGAKTTIPKGVIGPAQADRESAAMSYFIGRGYSREQAAGIVGNLVHESAGLAPSSRNPGDGSDGSDSVGIAQWNGDRARNLQAFAAARGKDWRDFGVQLAFVDHELNTDHAGVKAKLLAARTPDEAAGVFVTDYERPAGSQGGAAASHGWDNRRNQARRLAAGDYQPGEVEERAPDPVVASLSADDRSGLVSFARAQRSQGQAVAQGDLEPRVQDATRALTTIGRYDGRLPTAAEFSASYGPQDGARRYRGFERTLGLGADITAIRAMTPAEQTAWLAARAPKGQRPGMHPAFETERQLHERGSEAIALNQAFRRKDPNGYIRSLHPQIDRLWTEAGTSPERLKAALAATNAAMDRLGMPVEERRLMPKAMVDQALAAFGDTSKPMAQRLAPLRAALVASADPGAQQAIFGQMVSAGLPPMLEYAAIAYAKGDAALAERFATGALGRPDANGRATGGADDTSFASPVAAANTAAGPAPMRSLSGPTIDLGPAAAQALGSSLTGDERSNRAATVRTRMIEDAMRTNGGDRLAVIAQTDRDLASLGDDGWVPGMFMRGPGESVPIHVAQISQTQMGDASQKPTMHPTWSDDDDRAFIGKVEEILKQHRAAGATSLESGRPMTSEELTVFKEIIQNAEKHPLSQDPSIQEALRKAASKLGLIPQTPSQEAVKLLDYATNLAPAVPPLKFSTQEVNPFRMPRAKNKTLPKSFDKNANLSGMDPAVADPIDLRKGPKGTFSFLLSPGQYQPIFDNTNNKYGINPSYLAASAIIESKYPYIKGDFIDATARHGSMKGIFQFSPSTASEVGLQNPDDPQEAADGAARYAIINRNRLLPKIGREPTIAELYAAHQQGSGGVAALINHPNDKAINTIKKENFTGNVPESYKKKNQNWMNMTSKEFLEIYESRFPNELLFLPTTTPQ